MYEQLLTFPFILPFFPLCFRLQERSLQAAAAFPAQPGFSFSLPVFVLYASALSLHHWQAHMRM
jgi:hypothetical protein